MFARASKTQPYLTSRWQGEYDKYIMAELPSHSDTLCFNEYINELQDKEFKLDQFISKCRKKVTVECLRKDLDAYYRTLKSAMVELINKDYADFVNLSANLVNLA